MYDSAEAQAGPDPEMLRRHRAATQSSLDMKKVNIEKANFKLASIVGGVKDQKLGQGSPINKMKQSDYRNIGAYRTEDNWNTI